MNERRKHAEETVLRRFFDNEIFNEASSTPNKLTLFSNGDAAYKAMWRAMDAAEKRVWIEVFTYEKDEVGRRTLQSLTKASKRGCDVVLIYDRLGSQEIDGGFMDPLKEAGGLVVAFNPFWPWSKLGHRVGSILHRDHRKILVVDYEIGFCGGMNISEDYAGEELGNGRFYDMMLRLEGPAARRLASVFIKSLDETAHVGRSLPTEGRTHSAGHSEGAFAQVLGLNARRDKERLNLFISHALQGASERCFLTTPYFVPPDWFKKALIEAAVRGVDVRVLTAGRSDAPPVRTAGRYVYGDLLKSGVRVYEMEKPTLHAKSLTVDGVFVLVGSYNLDRWSSRHNLEVCVSAIDSDLAGRFEVEFFERLKQSRDVSLEDWRQRRFHRRLMQSVLYRLAVIHSEWG